MNANTSNPPPGWKVEWSPQYARHFYINLITNESTWVMPTALPPSTVQRQYSIQRKPVPSQASKKQSQATVPVQQANYIESYQTPPAQVDTGYFPQAPAFQRSPMAQYNQAPPLAEQQPNQQPNQFQDQGHAPQQFSPKTQYSDSLIPTQQEHTHHMQEQPSQQLGTNMTPAAIANSTVNQYHQQTLQTSSPPLTPGLSPAISHTAAPENQLQNYGQTDGRSIHHVALQQQGRAPYPHQAQQLQQPQNFVHSQQQLNSSALPSPPYQQQSSFPNQMQGQRPYQPNQRSSMGGSLTSGSMMNKMSSKFTQLQKGLAGLPTAAHPNGKPTDWKKWGKRAAIGVAGVGALALGIDAADDMFSGAEGLAGGDWSGGDGDFTGFESSGDATGFMDAQTAIDANYAQHAMEGIGQENASMLLDPVGTQYNVINQAEVNQAALALI